IAVIGAGAVGAYYGGRLAQHGHDVHFLLRSDYKHVAKNGWTIHSCHGDFKLRPGTMHVYDKVERMPKADWVIVALKATANDQLESLVAPLLKDNTLILTMQNGLGNEERLAELFGPQRVLGGLAFVCIHRVEPGVIHHIDHGYVRVGEFVESGNEKARAITDMFRKSKVECDVLDSLKRGRWAKLVWNVPFSGLGGALDMATDELMGSAEGEELVRAIMKEVIAGARGCGVELPADVIDRRMAETRTMGSYRSSMQIDRQQSRPMEVEAILGEPVRQAAIAGVAMPIVAELYRLVQVVNLAKCCDSR
ncbi:MAG TPA: putative 2-dehydropantoate 2-reductase, partial [Tepidisphaeraceae bacterium]|nr:putative 2-dehydropantoate 2-reductase [Tepidisphaeraceae bacterium]